MLVVDWLNDNEGFAIVVLTFGLVAVTVWYAWQTRGMVREMRDSRELSVLPHLALQFRFRSSKFAEIDVRNVGQGSALKVDLNLEFEDAEGRTLEVRPWQRSVFVPGQRMAFLPPRNEEQQLMQMDELVGKVACVRLRGSSMDSLGKDHRVDESLDGLAEWWEALKASASRAWTDDPADRLANEIEGVRNELRSIQQGMDRLGRRTS